MWAVPRFYEMQAEQRREDGGGWGVDSLFLSKVFRACTCHTLDRGFSQEGYSLPLSSNIIVFSSTAKRQAFPIPENPFMLQGLFLNWDPPKSLDCKLCQKVSVSEFANLQLHKTFRFRSFLKRKFSSGTKGEDCVG